MDDMIELNCTDEPKHTVIAAVGEDLDFVSIELEEFDGNTHMVILNPESAEQLRDWLNANVPRLKS